MGSNTYVNAVELANGETVSNIHLEAPLALTSFTYRTTVQSNLATGSIAVA